jgi:hypothetical protein
MQHDLCTELPGMSTLVNRKFFEWTFGLDQHQSRISIFEHIRDIPYSLAVPMRDPKTAPEQILVHGKGYCAPKHFLLAEMYRKLGLEVVYATFPFLWNDPDLQYPPELRILATGLPVAHHLACRVRINKRWVLVDTTWDLPLAKVGFPINEHWDGYADTKCAVKPIKSAVRTAFCRTGINAPCRDSYDSDMNPIDGEQDYKDAENHSRQYCKKISIQTEQEIQQIQRFYREFDAWLVNVREQ